MNLDVKNKLLSYFFEYITQNKKDKIGEAITNRTRYVTVVLEDVFQPYNASAVVRSTECFGIQNLHVIENQNKFSTTTSIARGASKWINIFRYNDAVDCLISLKEKGYRILLNMVPGVGPKGYEVLLKTFGSAENVFRASVGLSLHTTYISTSPSLS